jgi:tripartite-type tricarboxylate transporter receptor subunit TctC
MFILRLLVFISFHGLGDLVQWPASAQENPPSPLSLPGHGSVTIVVPYVPGGPSDIAGRILVRELTERLSRTVLVENVPGAGTMLGVQRVRSGPADGATLFLGDQALVSAAALNHEIRFDVSRDLAAVECLFRSDQFLMVPPLSPAQTSQDLISLGHTQIGGLTFGTPGLGSPPHLAALLFGEAASVPITLVPYKGAAQGLVDLAAGRLNAMFLSTASALEAVKAERANAIAYSGSERHPKAPDVPTLSELGLFSGQGVGSWWALFVRPDVDRDAIALWRAAIAALKSDASFAAVAAASGFRLCESTPEIIAELISRSSADWQRFVGNASPESAPP